MRVHVCRSRAAQHKLEGKGPQVRLLDKGNDPERMQQASERAPSEDAVEFPAFVEAQRGDGTTGLQENNELSYERRNVRLTYVNCLKQEFVLPFWKCTFVCSRRSEVCGPAVLCSPAS